MNMFLIDSVLKYKQTNNELMKETTDIRGRNTEFVWSSDGYRVWEERSAITPLVPLGAAVC